MILDDAIYFPDQIGQVLQLVEPELELVRKGKVYYFNTPCAFDTETTSWTDASGDRHGCMCCWTFGICGRVILGRTWDQWQDMMSFIVDRLCLGEHRFLIVYVHNLAYDWQWFRKRCAWSKVFSLEERQPIWAETTDGMIYKCSLKLTGKKLEKVGESL